jgi:hypothetical protein
MSAHVDVASYALGLLDQREESSFEAHLAECDTCAAELESMVPTLHALDGIQSPQVLESLGLPTQPAYGGERALREDHAGWTGAGAAAAGAAAMDQTWTEQDRWPQQQEEAWAEQDSWTDQERWPQQEEWPDTGQDQEWPEETWAEQPAASAEQPWVQDDRWPQQDDWSEQDAAAAAPKWTDDHPSGPIAPVEPIGRRAASGRREPVRREPARRESARPEPVDASVVRFDSAERRSGGRGDRVPAARESSGHSPRWRTPTMAAAAVISLGIITGGGYLAFENTQNQTTGTPPPSAKVLADTYGPETDPSTGVTAEAELFREAFGTQMSFTVTDIEGPVTCRLLLTKSDGSTEVLSTWKVPESGYGTEANPRGLTLDVQTANDAKDIESLKVQSIEDEVVSTLVTLRS